MPERFDIEEMLKDVEDDDDMDRTRSKSRLSQNDIQKIVADQLKKLREEQ